MAGSIYALVGLIFAVVQIVNAQSDTCALPTDLANAQCGPGTGYRCSGATCCSKYNYCGPADSHCGAGCQPAYGLCTGQADPCDASDSSPPPTSAVPLPKCPTKKTKLLGNYYTAYSGAPASKVPWSSTDLAFYFTAVTKNGTTGFAIPDGQTPISDFVKQAHKNGKQALLTIGGWTGSMYFSQLVSTATSAQNFALNIRNFIVDNDLDGVDLDWEYPNSAGIGCNAVSKQDTANYLSFLEILRSLLGSGKLITAAVAPLGFIGPDGNPLKDASGFARWLDYITLMVYDIYGPGYVQTSGPNGALSDKCSDIKAGANSAVAYWRMAGFPVCRMLLGIPSYGHGFTTLSDKLTSKKVNGVATSLYQPVSQTAPKGDATDTPSPKGIDACGNAQQGGAYSGVWTYNTLISGKILSADGKKGLGGYTRYWDACSSTPFLFNPAKKNLIAYDDAESVAAKAAYVKKSGLAGVNVFAYNGFNAEVFQAAKKSF